MGRSQARSSPRPVSPRSSGGSAPVRRSALRFARSPAGQADYAELSKRPLQILLFLSPLIVGYEFGSLAYLLDANGVGEVVAAQQIIERVFNIFGAFGLYLPGLALVAVLLVWHLLRKDPWEIRPGVYAGMFIESLAWTLPLLVLNGLLSPATPPAANAWLTAPLGPQVLADAGAWSWQARLTVALGAGIYEELLFRMIAIALIHVIVVDLFRRSDGTGRILAALVSAVAFSLYHAPTREPVFQPGVFLIYFVSGLYFAGVYIFRGFGTVVAVHALYDIVVLLWLNPDAISPPPA